MCKCSQCGEDKAEKEDPRDPPLDEGDCLCLGCFEEACFERRDELLSEAQQCEEDMRAAKKELEQRKKKSG